MTSSLPLPFWLPLLSSLLLILPVLLIFVILIFWPPPSSSSFLLFLAGLLTKLTSIARFPDELLGLA
jgi:hypothetical protein